MGLSIQHWHKTTEGVEIIQSQKPFCIDGALWQGHDGDAIRVREIQLTDDELKKIKAKGRDVDNTMDRVWKKRLDRLEGRERRKSEEYSERMATLRSRRNDILTSIRNSRELGVDESPEDKAAITEIDRRMGQLVDLKQRKSREIAALRGEDPPPEPVAPPEPESVKCDFCGKRPPTGHKNPPMWVHGHKMKCKARPKDDDRGAA